MNAQLPQPNLPNPPARPQLSGSKPFVDWVETLHRHLDNLRRSLTDAIGQLVRQVNDSVQTVGDVLDSTPGVITPVHPIHHVSGVGAIATINPPAPLRTPDPSVQVSGFSGPVFLIADGAWTLVVGGNIAAAVTAVVGKTVIVVYDPGAEMWYPALG